MELQLYKLIMLPTMIVTWLASNGSALAGFALSSSRLLRPLCMAYLANGLMVSATSVTSAKIILSYYQ